jgi:hypothetical protein
MGKKAWTTDSQRTWLEAEIPGFLEAQQSKGVALFLKELSNRWEAKWPTPSPTEEEIKKSKGVEEKAEATKRKFTENVRTHHDERTRLHADASPWSSSG